MTRVRAPSRLHFGLLNVPTAGTSPAERMFGGVGLMVAAPGVVVTVAPADEWRADGPSADRALTAAQRFTDSLMSDCQRPLHVAVETCPPEHIGLGVGTQLSLAVARAVAVEVGLPHLSAVELAERVGRGARSGVGVHGFDGGGLILDGGKQLGEAVSELRARVRLPEAWRVVLVCPRSAMTWHGDAERRAFAALATPAPGDTDRLRELWETLGRESEYAAFAEALHEYNRRAGVAFAAAQGGAYATPEAAELIARIRGLGVTGASQSSWGPTVLAIVPDEDRAEWLATKLAAPELAFTLVTKPDNTGGAVC